MTYIPTREGWLYLAAVLDVYSRAIVGWAMSPTLGGQRATDALAMAISRRGAPELVHSDRGSTYATSIYLKSRNQARASLFDYMEVFYNRQRRHSTINYVAPLAFEASNSA